MEQEPHPALCTGTDFMMQYYQDNSKSFRTMVGKLKTAKLPLASTSGTGSTDCGTACSRRPGRRRVGQWRQQRQQSVDRHPGTGSRRTAAVDPRSGRRSRRAGAARRPTPRRSGERRADRRAQHLPRSRQDRWPRSPERGQPAAGDAGAQHDRSNPVHRSRQRPHGGHARRPVRQHRASSRTSTRRPASAAPETSLPPPLSTLVEAHGVALTSSRPTDRPAIAIIRLGGRRR